MTTPFLRSRPSAPTSTFPFLGFLAGICWGGSEWYVLMSNETRREDTVLSSGMLQSSRLAFLLRIREDMQGGGAEPGWDLENRRSVLSKKPLGEAARSEVEEATEEETAGEDEMGAVFSGIDTASTLTLGDEVLGGLVGSTGEADVVAATVGGALPGSWGLGFCADGCCCGFCAAGVAEFRELVAAGLSLSLPSFPAP